MDPLERHIAVQELIARPPDLAEAAGPEPLERAVAVEQKLPLGADQNLQFSEHARV